MTTASSRRSTVLVVAESAADANLVMDAVAMDPVLCRACIDAEDLLAVTDTAEPDVLLLACRGVAASLERLGRLFAGARAARRPRQRVLLLCDKDELRAAFDACRENLADDYVQFWPMPLDGYRLRLALRSLRQQLNLQREIQAAAGVLQQAARYPAPEPRAVRLPPGAGAASPMPPPAATAAARPAPPAAAPAQPAMADAAAPAAQARVLLVDDDPFQYKLTRTVLSGLPLELLWASSGHQALELSRQGRPDLILMDINMPDLDGIETVRGMRTQSHLRDVPIIMLTGNSERTRVVQSLSAGATGFIVKPFTRKMLHELIAKHLHSLALP